MTATIGLPRPGQARPREHRAELAGTLRSEFTKISSVRSTYWTLLALLVTGIATGATYCASEAARWTQTPVQDKAAFDPVAASVAGLILFGQLIIVVLGALAITSEYSTGMIRTSLTVMPRRGTLYGAKAAVLAAVTLVVTLPASFAAFFLGQALLTSTHLQASLSHPAVARAVIASALYVTLCGLFTFALGAILRHTAGAITAAFGLIFLLPQLARALPAAWYQDAERWLPGGSITVAMTGTKSLAGQHLFSAWGEFAVFGGYTAILLIAGAVLFFRRDA
jgi:ABC-type transport system involved in multi-copper enzyme maturation permease subunit